MEETFFDNNSQKDSVRRVSVHSLPGAVEQQEIPLMNEDRNILVLTWLSPEGIPLSTPEIYQIPAYLCPVQETPVRIIDILRTSGMTSDNHLK